MLKDIIFTFGKKTLTQKRENSIGTKFAPPYSILFMVELEENIIKESEYKLYLWWRYTDEIIFFWERGENKLKSFIHKINKVHPNKVHKIYSRLVKNFYQFFRYYCISYRRIKETDLYLTPTDSHQYLQSSLCHPFDCRKCIPFIKG